MSRRPTPSDEESQAADEAADEAIGHEAGAETRGTENGFPRTVYDRLAKAAKDELIYPSEENTILNLATLQRMLLFHLQLKIIKEAGALANRNFSNGNPLDALKTPMADYAQAVRDWELMANYRAKAFGDLSWDPFQISNKGKLISEQMNTYLPKSQGKYTSATLESELGTFSQRTQLTKDRSLRAFSRRFAAALFGGITLIGPMLLMVLHKDRATDLSTTSVAVCLFAIVVAYFSDASPETIVSIVAAYAAVLVVFVGTLQ